MRASEHSLLALVAVLIARRFDQRGRSGCAGRRTVGFHACQRRSVNQPQFVQCVARDAGRSRTIAGYEDVTGPAVNVSVNRIVVHGSAERRDADVPYSGSMPNPGKSASDLWRALVGGRALSTTTYLAPPRRC
jgi:hypothetical protein